VAAAPSGSEALALVDERGPFDLLLSDVMLPGEFSGPELAIEATGRQPSMKVLLMSGYSSDALEGKTSPQTHADLLQKPFSMGTLAKKIRTVLKMKEEVDSGPD
jgi:DNA-binding NtrC family response regulator